MIYEGLADEEDMSSLMHSCRQLRCEVLSRMPGGCTVDYTQLWNHEQDHTFNDYLRDKVQVELLTFIAEPWYSPGSALKVQVTWRLPGGPGKTKTSSWAIRDLSSPMAYYIGLYRPECVSIEFEAPTKGCSLLALLILRAKVFDIRQLMRTYLRLPARTRPFDSGYPPGGIQILFRGGLDPDRPHTSRKSFWLMRPPGVVSAREGVGQAKYKGRTMRTSGQRREVYPYFYECLEIPLTSFWRVRPAGYVLDLPVAGRQARLPRTGWNPGECWTELERLAEDVPKLLRNTICPEADQLRAYLNRMRCAPARNPFAGPVGPAPNPRAPGIPAENEDMVMRRNLIKWALVQDPIS
jgi:hypothetical protein